MSGADLQTGAAATALGRAVQRSGSRALDTHHQSTNSLRDLILGGQDGLVNMLGIVLGVVAANGTTEVLIAAGLAAAITESISMGAVAYTSFGSDRDFYLATRRRENEEIQTEPEVEREEVRRIYAIKGFEGRLLDEVVQTITSNRDAWVDTVMDEELHLQPVEKKSLFKSAIVVTLATLVGHMIPIVPFMIFDRVMAVILAVALSAIALFSVGVYSAKTLIGDWRRSGLQMVVIGLGAAALGFLIARLFHTTAS